MDARQVWQAALERVRRRVSPGAFTTWFGGTAGLELAGGRLVVAAPSAFAAEHLRQRFGEQARVAVSEAMGRSAEIAFVVRPAPAPPLDAGSPRPLTPGRRVARGSGGAQVAQQVAFAVEPRPAPIGGSRQRTARARLTAGTMQPPLVPLSPRSTPHPQASAPVPREQNAPAVEARTESHPEDAPADAHPRYDFATFVVGTANRLAYAAAQQVADAPGADYNPLLIYGGVGLGKTHLLHAIGHTAAQHGLAVAYVTAERFTNEIIEAIRLRTTEAFRARYRVVDVLLVDDIQFIAGKESTEEEFFHTFNTLHEANKQIVLTSDRVPRAMHHLHDRLRSRFEWGLIADIQPPDEEHRLAILRAKAAGLRIPIGEDALAVLARPECESIRALEGTLNRVLAHARMLGQPPNARLVEQALAPLAAERVDRQLECGEVLAAVARHFDLRMEALAGKSRERGVAWARQVAMYLLRQETPASLLRIGRELGGRDHTTVMHGCAKVSEELARNARAREDVAAVRALLRA
ncbi:MAG TPA: chromosomal replication initiator protein DnaA [Ktedonobacterales bacterium]|nr:chromosomal replication initiator protein DnaA [Ktedonobacterales bacterium]